MGRTELYRTFAACMAAFLHETSYALPPLTAAQWGKLYNLAKRQSLSGALFAAVSDNDMPDTVRDRLRRDGFLMLTKYEAQKEACRAIEDALSSKDIAHVFVKGAVIRRYYPDPALRSMGDIDVVIHEHDRLRADRAMQDLGFAVTEQLGDVWVYERDGYLVEVHTVLRRFDVTTQTPVEYTTLWTDARHLRGSSYRLSNEAEAAYVISHLASHFAAGGCGLRQLMDVAVLYRRFPDEALWHGVFAKLAPDGTARFAQHLLWLCARWFSLDIPDTLTAPVDEQAETHMLYRLLADGTFGTDERLLIAQKRKEQRLQKQGGELGRVWRHAFPDADTVRRRYPYAKHTWLLPVAYGHRLLDAATKHRTAHKRRAAYAKDRADEIAQELALFDAMDL